MDEKLHSKEFPDCFYRVSIKGLCVRDGKVMLARKNDAKGERWVIPGGGLEFGEQPYAGLQREIMEEMGLPITKISEKPVYVWTHKHVQEYDTEWFYSCLIIYQIELEHLNFTPSIECDEVRFFSKEELQTLSLNGQASRLKDIFDPKDFEKDF